MSDWIPGSPPALVGDVVHAAAQLIGIIGTGRKLSTPDAEAILFHLQSLMAEHQGQPLSPSQLSMYLASRIAPVWNMQYPTAGTDPAWYGDTGDGETLASVIRADLELENLAEEQIAAYLKFYNGEQWDADVMARRMADRRPTLTVNWLPAIVSRILTTQPEMAQNEQFVRAVCVAVTRRNMDAQKIYNYAVSSAAERMSERAQTVRAASEEPS